MGTTSKVTGNDRSIAVRDEIASTHEIFTCAGVLRPDLCLYAGRRLSNLTSDHLVTPVEEAGSGEIRTEPTPPTRAEDRWIPAMPSCPHHRSTEHRAPNAAPYQESESRP
ncbi:MAG TPA: hypothetical protein VFN97_26335 [Actinospica sp.]|nr:hypothetical protein [Actinospica sp.]